MSRPVPRARPIPMSVPRPFRLLAPVLAAAVPLLFAPPPAAGQDFGDVLERLLRLRELREELENRDRDDRDRDRSDRDRRDRDRRDRDVVPTLPPAQAPPGLYGGNYGQNYGGYAPRNDGRDAYGPTSPYGPASPYGSGTSYGPTTPFGGGADRAGSDGAYTFVTSAVSPGRYRVTNVPGGPLSVRVVAPDRRDDRDDRGRDQRNRDQRGRDDERSRAVFAAAREANRQAAEIGRVAAEMEDPLRDLRYGLNFAAGNDGRGNRDRGRRDDFASNLARQAEVAERQRAAVAVAARPRSTAYARVAPGSDAASSFGVRGGDDFDKLRDAARAFDGTLHSLAEPIGRQVRDPWLRGKAADLERLDGELHTAFAAMEAARQRVRDAQAPDRPGFDRPGLSGPGAGGNYAGNYDGGRDRVRLFALAARLTERTAELRRAVSGDGGRSDGRYGSAYRGGYSGGYDNDGYHTGGQFGGTPLGRLTDRADDAAETLLRTISENASDAEIAGADDQFEQIWRAWQQSARAALPDDHPVRAAGRRVDEVDRRLVTRVAEARDPGEAGRLAARASALSRAAGAFSRALPRFKLAEDPEFVRGVDRLAAAADYYASAARTSAPGAEAELRARRVLSDALNRLDDPLDTIADRPRDNEAADLVREIVEARDEWRELVGRG